MKFRTKFLLNAMLVVCGFVGEIFNAQSTSSTGKKKIETIIIRVATAEDHPWVIKNETCLNHNEDKENGRSACYSGYLIDMLDKICLDLSFNYTIEFVGPISKLINNKTNPQTWLGVIGAILEQKADLALAPLNITQERKEVVQFSTAFINNSNKNKTFALAFPKDSTIVSRVSHVIKKLTNQRYLEQLEEKWFNDEREYWDEKKQITQL